MTTPYRRTLSTLCLLAPLALAACAAPDASAPPRQTATPLVERDDAEQERQTRDVASADPPAEPAGPVFTPAPDTPSPETPRSEASASRTPQDVDADRAGPLPPVPQDTRAPRGARSERSLRPSWWIDEPVSRSGRLSVAAEALGNDVLSARRLVVDAAREALAHALEGRPVADERIEYVAVQPLPRDPNVSGAARFIAFARISAVDPARTADAPDETQP
jgi:hypothetical protein